MPAPLHRERRLEPKLTSPQLARYPYVLKLLWAPLVDAIWSRRVGRHLSWVAPAQILAGLLLAWVAPWAGQVSSPRADERPPILHLTAAFFSLIVLMASQDIAVDGWALVMLPRRLRAWASSCQSIGLTVGSFLSFTVFMTLNSADVANRFRENAGETGWVSIESYLRFWAAALVVTSVVLLVMVRGDRGVDREEEEEEAEDTPMGVRAAYRQFWALLQRPAVRHLAVVLVLSKFGFVNAYSTAFSQRLRLAGFPKEAFYFLEIVFLPFGLAVTVYAGRWVAAQPSPVLPWRMLLPVRGFVSLAIAGSSYAAWPYMRDPVWRWGVIGMGVALRVFDGLVGYVMFVAYGAFFVRSRRPCPSPLSVHLLFLLSPRHRFPSSLHQTHRPRLPTSASPARTSRCSTRCPTLAGSGRPTP